MMALAKGRGLGHTPPLPKISAVVLDKLIKMNLLISRLIGRLLNVGQYYQYVRWMRLRQWARWMRWMRLLAITVRDQCHLAHHAKLSPVPRIAHLIAIEH